MADMTSGAAPQRVQARGDIRTADTESGWVTFAGAMLAMVGTLNIIYGIAAIDDANVYVGDVTYVFGSLNTWGWFLLIVGAVQILTAFGIWNGNQIARWVGVVLAAANAIILLLFLPAFPLLTLALFATDLLVIYGLIAHGGRPEPV